MTANQFINPYTPEHLKFMRDNYESMPVKKIAERIGHPVSSVYTMASQMGLKKWKGKLVWDKRNYFKLDLSDKEIGYVAGLMDADGSIGSSGKYYQPRVQITNTNTNVMKWLLDNIGGVVYKESSSTGLIKSRKQVYRWQLLKNKEVIGFLELIIPLLIIKKSNAVKLWKIKSG